MSRFSKTRTGKELGSKQFFELIRSIGEAKSKQEEDKIIAKEIAVLKTKMGEKDIDKKQMKEYVVRLLYCEMLGHQADFGYIHCVNLIASPDLLQKRTGYLAVQLTISPENDLLLLVVAAIQKDLKSSNCLEVACALNAATKLIRSELMECLVKDVQKCLKHASPLVRKKAIVCIHAFWRRDDMGVGDAKQYQEVLCDKDPAVMACALGFLQDLCCLNPIENKHLVSSFVSILRQICEHRLPKEYDYHRIPAPWIQIKLLKLLAILCHQDVEKSKAAYTVLNEVMKRADSSGINIGHAVIFECVKTITCLAPERELIEAAAEAISKFLKSLNPNLKYLGITSLSRIVLIDPRYAAQHRDIVMDCLEDHDETIKRKTLDLLYAMTNLDSVEVIVGRLIKFLAAAHDVYLKSDLVSNICDLAYRFYPTMEWYINTMNNVLKLGEHYVDNQTVQGMLKMIAEGSDELTEEENEKFRLHSVDNYFLALDTTDKLPETLMQIIAWVLGEYGYMSKQNSKNDIIDKLCDLLERTEETETRGYIITALMKLTAHTPEVPTHVLELVLTYKSSFSLALQQRCYEFLELAKYQELMTATLPLDGCCEDLKVDPVLSFLDGVVKTALVGGAPDYIPKDKRNAENEDKITALKTETYENPMDSTGPAAPPADTDKEPVLVLPQGKSTVWGKENLTPEKEDDAPVDTQQRVDDEDEEDEMNNNHTASANAYDEASSTAVKVKKGKKSEREKLGDLLFSTGPKKSKAVKKAEKERKRMEKEARRAADDGSGSPQLPQQHLSTASSASHNNSDSLGELFGRQPSPAPVSSPASIQSQLVPVNPQVVMPALAELWKSHTCEGTGSVPLGGPVPIDDVCARVQLISNITKVQVIDKEYMAAAQHPTGYVLAHFKLAPDHLSMKIRSASPDLTQAVVMHIANNLLG